MKLAGVSSSNTPTSRPIHSSRTHWNRRDRCAIKARVRRVPCFAYAQIVGGFLLRILLRVYQLFAVVLDWNAILCWRVRRQRNRLGRNLARRICIASGTRPRKIVGAASRRYQGCTAAHDLRRNRVGRGLCGVALRANEIAALTAADGKWQYRADIWPGAGRSRHWRRFRTGQRHRHYLARHHSAEITVDITCEFHRTSLGEMHAVSCAQPTGLAFKVRTLAGIASLIIDKAVPNVDVNNPSLFSALAIQSVQIAYVAGRPSATNRRQSDPNNRHTLALKRRHHRVDALQVERRPFVGLEII